MSGTRLQIFWKAHQALKEADLFARLARLIAWQTCLWRSGGTSGMKVLLWGSSLWPYGVAENIT